MSDRHPKPQPDDRPAQASRVADYLEAHPHSTQEEIDAAVTYHGQRLASHRGATLRLAVDSGGAGTGDHKTARWLYELLK